MLDLRTMTRPTLTSLALAVPAMADKTAGETVDDTTTATQTKAAPDAASKVEGVVTVLDAMVVRSAQAGEIARGISGVKQVHNSIVATH